MSDSLEALIAGMREAGTFHGPKDSDEFAELLREYADRLESLARQNREEVAVLRKLRDQLNDGVLAANVHRVAAEAALGEVREYMANRADEGERKAIALLARMDEIARTSKETSNG